MSDKSATRAKLIRSVLGTLAAGTYVGGQAAGYDYGAGTTAGVDAGLLRDGITTALAMAATFWPALSRVSVLWRSLTNDDRVTKLADTVDTLTQRVAALEQKSAAT